MRINQWKKVAVSAAVVAASIGAGAAWASQYEDPTGLPAGQAPTPASGDRLIGTGVNDVKFVPLTPCRLVDTRVPTPSQRFTNGGVRSFKVRGTGAAFAAQGGKADGCGVPGAVTAVEVTVTAVDASANGFLRVYPDTQPVASFLSFGTTASSSNTGTVSVCGHKGGICQINKDLTVKAFGAGTDVVIDISGYYARPMAARINGDGTIQAASRVTGVVVAPFGTVGTYNVTFDRDVTKCVPQVTPMNLGFTASAFPSGAPGTVFVVTRRSDGATVPTPFNIEVAC